MCIHVDKHTITCWGYFGLGVAGRHRGLEDTPEVYMDGLVQDCSISSALAMELLQLLQSCIMPSMSFLLCHDDVIKWKHFPRYWPFVREIHRSPVNSLHKGQWRGALMFSLICVWINGLVNNCEAGDLRRYQAHYNVTVMCYNWNLCNQRT